MASFSSHKGKVKWWSDEKGYGSIKRDDGEKDIFVHCNDIQSEHRKLCAGVTVRFEIKTDSKGRKYAANVIKITGNLAIGTRESVVWNYVIFLVAGYSRRSAKQCPEDIILLISNNVYRKERNHEQIDRAPAEVARAVMPLYLKHYLTNSKFCDPSKWHKLLYRALKDSNTALAKALIQHKAEAVTHPLIQATIDGNIKMVRILLTDPDVDVNHRSGSTALYAACKRGHDEIVEALLNHKADHSVMTNEGATPLSVAVREGNAKCVELLLQFGANVSSGGNLGVVPSSQNCTMLDFLLKSGGALFETNQNGMNVFGCTVQRHSVSAVRSLFEYLMRRRTEQEVRILVEHRDAKKRNALDMMFASEHEYTTIYWYSWTGHDVIKYLMNTVKLNVSKTHKLSFSKNLYMASKDCAILDLLLKSGANLFETDHEGRNVFGYAAQCHSVDEMKSLFEYISNVKTHQEVRRLVEHRDTNGNTALHLAISRWYNRLERMKYLVNTVNINVSIQNQNGQTVLQIAERSNCDDVASWLSGI